MFKLTIPIIKTSKLANGRLVVEGVASDPTIDSDNEKFAPEAIKHMKELLNKERIPIRMEHEDKIYTNIGEWMEADIDEKNMLKVKGEIDTELSLGKDIEVLANRGEAISLSVGGNVLQAGYEYSKDLGKNIKIYKDVLLKEISIVKNPANSNTSLSLAKSVDWKAVEKSKKMAYTTEAQKMISFYKSMEQVTPEKFIALEKR